MSIVCIVLSVHHAISIPNHLIIPYATPTSNSLYQHHLFVLLVFLLLYIPFSNLTNTELYNLLLINNFDLSNIYCNFFM